jgi:hypothetical protein
VCAKTARIIKIEQPYVNNPSFSIVSVEQQAGITGKLNFLNLFNEHRIGTISAQSPHFRCCGESSHSVVSYAENREDDTINARSIDGTTPEYKPKIHFFSNQCSHGVECRYEHDRGRRFQGEWR